MEHIASGYKSPDNMSRAELLKAIKALASNKKEAMQFWLKYASHKVSRKAFEGAVNGIN